MPHLSPMRRVAVLLCTAALSAGTACVTAAERLELGIADVQAGRIEQGIAAIEKELADDGLGAAERARAHAFAGHGWKLLHEPERALAHYERGRVDDPNDPWLCYASGVAMQELGRYTEAIAAFTGALRLDRFPQPLPRLLCPRPLFR
jgi:tetratricopeptide (TPR) repeat protein